jgi:hypothetical protein
VALTRRQRLRRVGILCCYALSNLAFYRAWHDAGKPRANEQFWVAANGNFADITVLEWCKLFADVKGRHHWSKVVSDQTAFSTGLLAALDMTQQAFDAYIQSMRVLRDKFIAHLDDEPVFTLPQLDAVKGSTVFLYEHLLAHENEANAFHDAPDDPEGLYKSRFDEAVAVYAR